MNSQAQDPGKKVLYVYTTPELNSDLAVLMGSGRYRTKSEVVRCSIRLLRQLQSYGDKATVAVDRGDGDVSRVIIP